MNSKQLLSRRGFASLYNYSSPSNPRVFLTVAKGDNKIGELVFELYSDKQPATTESFRTLCAGSEG